MSDKRAKYLASKKTGRKVIKRELNEQLEFCDWLRTTFPGIHFRCDTSAGDFNSNYEKQLDNRQRSAKGLPDIEILAARRGFHALFIELKATGEEIRLKRDARVPYIRKNSKGKVVERELTPRKQGDYKTPHLDRQHKRHEELKEAGYCAGFALGLEHAKEVTCWYFDIPYSKQESLF